MPGLDLQERSEDAAKDAVHSLSMSEKKPLESHKVRDPGQGTTFAAQDNLPRLPIPELEETCMRYLDALAPLQSLKEHNDTAAAVRDFLRYDGQYLQERLMQYAEDKSSYIEQFCQYGRSQPRPVLLTIISRVRLISKLRQSRSPQPEPVFLVRG